MTKPPDPKKGGAWVSETRQHRAALSALSWDAVALWRQLRGYCADQGLDGVLPKRKLHVAVERRITEAKARKILVELLEEDLVVETAETFVLDWSDQPSAEVWNDPVKRMRWSRGKALLRDTQLCNRIKERDRNLCRYCGVRVDWNNKVGKGGGTYDHVDPDGDNSLENVVVSCRRCNGRKRDRTPDQAGMTLLKPGTTAAQAAEVRCRGSTPGQPPADSGPSRPSRARARPDTANPGSTQGQPAADQDTGVLDRARADLAAAGLLDEKEGDRDG